MVCIYCKSKTGIVNSRFNKELFKTWRRHKCTKCHATFTTYEQIDTRQSVKVIKNSGELEAFDEHKLFISIFKAVENFKNNTIAAKLVLDSVLRHVYCATSLPTITSSEIGKISALALKRYDTAAAIKYLSYKHTLQSSRDIKKVLKSL